MFIDEMVSNAEVIGITGHIRPDGDCVGSTLGLYNYLVNKYPDKNINIYLEELTEKLRFLKNTDKIDHSYGKDTNKQNMVHDLFIVLDVSNIDRIGDAENFFENAKKTFCIDHHVSNTVEFTSGSVIKPTYSSTCEVLYELLDESDITEDVAECLYTGMIHDTGVFKYQSTTLRTMCIAGKLMEKGIPFQNIIDGSFYAKSYAQNMITSEAVLKSKMCMDGKCLYTCLSLEDISKYGLTSKDLDGVVDQLRLTIGVECAILIYELNKEEYKISLRAKNYMNVSEIAMEFGGGGHIRAAGCTIYGNLDKGLEKLLGLVSLQIK